MRLNTFISELKSTKSIYIFLVVFFVAYAITRTLSYTTIYLSHKMQEQIINLIAFPLHQCDIPNIKAKAQCQSDNSKKSAILHSVEYNKLKGRMIATNTLPIVSVSRMLDLSKQLVSFSAENPSSITSEVEIAHNFIVETSKFRDDAKYSIDVLNSLLLATIFTVLFTFVSALGRINKNTLSEKRRVSGKCIEVVCPTFRDGTQPDIRRYQQGRTIGYINIGDESHYVQVIQLVTSISEEQEELSLIPVVPWDDALASEVMKNTKNETIYVYYLDKPKAEYEAVNLCFNTAFQQNELRLRAK